MRPGVLTDKEIIDLINGRSIFLMGSDEIPPEQIQPNTIDLTVGRTAHRIRSSFLPRKGEKIEDLLLPENYSSFSFNLSGEQGGVLEQGKTYLIPLRETFALPKRIWGHANPKSSTGRIDVLVRMVSEGNNFDILSTGFKGRVYLEVTPLSFPIRVREGDSLNQLRLVSGDPSLNSKELKDVNEELLDEGRSLLYDAKGKPIKNPSIDDKNGLILTADLSRGTVIYRSKRSTQEIDLRKRDHKIDDFFERITVNGGEYTLNPHEFILVSTDEFVSIPQQNVCAEMIPIDLQIGSFRSHYAGFFDSGFGFNESKEDKSGMGSQATLEVRAFDVPFRVVHGQIICDLKFFYNSGEVLNPYGVGRKSNYKDQKQGAKPPKYFKT